MLSCQTSKKWLLGCVFLLWGLRSAGSESSQSEIAFQNSSIHFLAAKMYESQVSSWSANFPLTKEQYLANMKTSLNHSLPRYFSLDGDPHHGEWVLVDATSNLLNIRFQNQ